MWNELAYEIYWLYIMGMKRYWLFAGDNYYPTGGMGDFIGSYDSVDDAINSHARTNDPTGEWGEVIDSITGDQVKAFFVRDRDDPTEWKD